MEKISGRDKRTTFQKKENILVKSKDKIPEERIIPVKPLSTSTTVKQPVPASRLIPAGEKSSYWV